jgi:hypothetical protein
MERWNHRRTFRIVRIVALVFSLMAISLASVSTRDATMGSAVAAERKNWFETNYQESVLVQLCGGFDLTSSYTANLDRQLLIDDAGDEVFEQLNVEFAGSLNNAVSGKAYQYNGNFTRWSNYIQGRVTITDLALRFEVGAPGEFTVAVDRIEMNLVADPTEVIKQFVPNTLQLELCSLPAQRGGVPAPQVASYQERLHSAPESQVASYLERLASNPKVGVRTDTITR